MGFTADVFSVTTLLLVVFALFVIYIRFKNWLDSNVPLIFYIAMIVYVRSVDVPSLPLWLILVGFALGGLLRFEFMNPVVHENHKDAGNSDPGRDHLSVPVDDPPVLTTTSLAARTP